MSAEDSLVINGTKFQLDVFLAEPSRADRFALAKPRWLIDEYVALASEMIGGRIIELGIAQGGSVALFAELFQPAALLAIELDDPPNRVLTDWVSRRPESTIHTAYGVDQADRAAIEALVASHFGEGPLDLVVDDASHLYGPSVESFEVLFPLLRPGGVYVLEDWSAALFERAMQADPQRFAADLDVLEGRPRSEMDLSRLVIQLALGVAYSPEVVSEVRIRNGFALVRRGTAPLDRATFRVDALYGSIGRKALS